MLLNVCCPPQIEGVCSKASLNPIKHILILSSNDKQLFDEEFQLDSSACINLVSSGFAKA